MKQVQSIVSVKLYYSEYYKIKKTKSNEFELIKAITKQIRALRAAQFVSKIFPKIDTK